MSNNYAESLIVTKNKYGFTTYVPNEAAEQFISFLGECKGSGLDIGAAFGVATLPALATGAHVIANDRSQVHLDKLYEDCPPGLRSHLTCRQGAFPQELSLPPASLDAILASQVLHFLRGTEIEAGAEKMLDWLKPGGKVFIIAATAHIASVTGFLPHYLANKTKGLRWPGEVEDIQAYSDHPAMIELPPFLHLLDDEVLQRSFTESGFRVEKCALFTSAQTPPDYRSTGGNENVLLVAQKPS